MSATSDHDHLIWDVLTRIREHVDGQLTVARMVAWSGLSQRQFYRDFERVSGESPAAHIRRLRLERGAIWLAYSDATVIEAAMAAGYQSREAFTRHFHRQFGYAPSLFRDRLHGQIRKEGSRRQPACLRLHGLCSLPPLPLAVWPCLGPARHTLRAWRRLGEWAVAHELLSPQAQPVSVLYDDDDRITPMELARHDAALVIDGCAYADNGSAPVYYRIPPGCYATADFHGPLRDLDRAWDYFALAWFAASGLQLRDSRMLMLHAPGDVPTSPIAAARILAGRPVSCRLCIPVDCVPGSDLPLLAKAVTRGARPHCADKGVNSIWK